ncbi:ADP-heptose:LPS heptosyltransferase [Verrucomicrobium sp. GAS474]|uniref:glycosyltransferase family 9 protein n=1 Tax=Verrucomicrobium sp. GAS474 TaxID=1882831 RepID=UPI00087A0CC8|nr:hypothetical protein [Verrucomicrobium sp. GAS474]SDU00815.1 ADP-heptose:LPS heptosyltransferase [Verrucomicrobium sp. GAS474]
MKETPSSTSLNEIGNDTAWRTLLGRRYIAGRRFTLLHAAVYRTIDAVAELLWPHRRAHDPARPLPLDRITVAKVDHIGDLLMATPFLAGLKRGHPGVSILLIVGRWNRGCAELLKRIGLCDEVEYLDLPLLNGGGGLARLRTCLADVRRLRPLLRKREPSTFVELRPYTPNAIFLGGLAKAAYRVGFGTRGLAKLLDREIPYDGVVPMGQLLLNALPLFGVPPEPGAEIYRGPVLPGFPKAESAGVAARFGLAPGGYFVLHMESREASREVSAAVWTEILTRVAPQGGGRRFVLVGKTAGPTGEAVLAALAAAGIPALSVAGQTSFDDLFHLAQAAAGTICIDSLGAHLSLSFRRPTLVLMRAGFSHYGSFPVQGADLPLFFAPVEEGEEEERAAAALRFTRAVV